MYRTVFRCPLTVSRRFSPSLVVRRWLVGLNFKPKPKPKEGSNREEPAHFLRSTEGTRQSFLETKINISALGFLGGLIFQSGKHLISLKPAT